MSRRRNDETALWGQCDEVVDPRKTTAMTAGWQKAWAVEASGLKLPRRIVSITEQVNVSAKITSSEQVTGTVIACLAKKAFPRHGWAWDRYRIELLVVPEIRAVMMDAHRAILAKPRADERRGAPTRIPRWIEDYSKQG